MGALDRSRGRLTAGRPPIYYIDASVQAGVAEALALVRSDIEYPGKPGCPVSHPRVKDEIWLPIAGQRGWVVIMRDKRIRTRPREREALRLAGVRAFCLTGAGNYSKWETLALLIREWPRIERIAVEEAGPYICSVTQEGTKRLTS
jgi:hypothetical protein